MRLEPHKTKTSPSVYQANAVILAEVSGTSWNLALIYKICSSLYVLIGLQRNILHLLRL